MVQIYSVGFLHLQLIHILALSPQVTVFIAWVLARHIQVWNQDSLSYGMESGWCRLHCKPLFQSTITGVVVQDFENLFCTCMLLTRVIWSSHADLWFGSSQANRSVFNTLSWHALPVGGCVTQHVNNQPPSW